MIHNIQIYTKFVAFAGHFDHELLFYYHIYLGEYTLLSDQKNFNTNLKNWGFSFPNINNAVFRESFIIREIVLKPSLLLGYLIEAKWRTYESLN